MLVKRISSMCITSFVAVVVLQLLVCLTDADLLPSQNFPLPPPVSNTEIISKTVDNTSADTSAALTQESKRLIELESILTEIFKADFDPLGIQSDGVDVEPTTAKLAVKNVTLGNIHVRQSRAQLYQHRRGRRPPNRKHNGNMRRQVAQQAQVQKKQAGLQAHKKGTIETTNGLVNPNTKGKIDLAKYNAYMDAVLTRMNALIRKKRMDPLRVNLYAGPNPGQNKFAGQTKPKNSGKTKKKGGARWDDEESGSQMASDEEGDSDDHDDSGDEEGRSFTVIKPSLFQRRMRALDNITDENPPEGNSGASAVDDDKETEPRGKTKSALNRKPSKDKNRAKGPPKKRNSPRPTRGILHGLSSLRREGNVQVVKDGARARIIRSRFLLGPVALEILPKKTKQKSSGEDDSDAKTTPAPPAATATAPQLKGILEIRLSPGKPTRIRKLRVFPPGNIQVDGDKRTTSPGVKRAGYRKVTPMATARLRQTAIQVLRQVDNKMKTTGTGNQGDLRVL